MRILLASIFILFQFRCIAHTDLIFSINKDDIYIEYLTGWKELEINNKTSILLDFSSRLLKAKNYNDIPLYIYFDHNYTKSDSSNYALSYGYFKFRNDKKKKSEKDSTIGIKIYIRERSLNIKKVLNLINCSFSNINFIKKNQKNIPFRIRYNIHETVSIPLKNITNYLSQNDSIVNQILSQKFFLFNQNIHDGLYYYFQNNQYHIITLDSYVSENIDEVDFEKLHYRDLLVVDDILEKFGSYNDGYFIFTNDSIFFYFTPSKGKLTGPFKVDNLNSGRPPVFKYLFDDYPIKKFTLFFEDYDSEKKALFFPDKNIVISNYEKIENQLINDLIKSKNQKKTDGYDKTSIIIFITLTISIFLNIFLILKKK